MNKSDYMREYMRKYRKTSKYRSYQREYQRSYQREYARTKSDQLEELRCAIRTLLDDGAMTLTRGVSAHADKSIDIIMEAAAS